MNSYYPSSIYRKMASVITSSCILKRIFILSPIILVSLAGVCSDRELGEGSFAIQDGQFLRNGDPHLIIGGELHYPRIPRAYWRDRMRKARAMGLNTIATYIFWNLHEPEPGEFDFSANLDVAEFVRIAQQEGLDVIIRPGPYICAETDFGGFPSWLLRSPHGKVRSRDPEFLHASQRYLNRVASELRSLEVQNGGPIIMVQVENEYNSYAEDQKYLQVIHKQFVKSGWDVPMFTSDWQPSSREEANALPNVLRTTNMGGRIHSGNSGPLLQRDSSPPFVSEYWAGWFDQWGTPRSNDDPGSQAQSIEWMLENDVSFILYMFHGGTSFGYMSGANHYPERGYEPQISSYDYNAALDEAGRPTSKYYLFRQTIHSNQPATEEFPPVPQNKPLIEILPFPLQESVNLLDSLSTVGPSIYAENPLSMEELGQRHGFVLYRYEASERLAGNLQIEDLRDFGSIMIDGVPIGVMDRRHGQQLVPVTLEKGAVLDVLVENMGRTNYGPLLPHGHRGIIGDVRIGVHKLQGWRMWGLPIDNLQSIRSSETNQRSGPVFLRGNFPLTTTGDTFLDMSDWGKGHVWVNGHHLGRYWNIGPQQTLYLPGVWLVEGENEVVVFETVRGSTNQIEGIRNAIFE